MACRLGGRGMWEFVREGLEYLLVSDHLDLLDIVHAARIGCTLASFLMFAVDRPSALLNERRPRNIIMLKIYRAYGSG